MVEVREYHWELTGWRASLVGGVLLLIPVAAIFGAGFLLGRSLAIAYADHPDYREEWATREDLRPREGA